MPAVAAIAIFMASMSSAAATCRATGPSVLDLFLSGQNISNTIHEQLIEAAGRRETAGERVKSLLALDHALNNLNTKVWGLYWVSLYSGHLHEILGQLDSKPPGPVTQYYDRWDGAQLGSSAALVKHEANTVNNLLTRTSGVSAEHSAILQQYLRRIDNELLGCAP